MKQRKKLIHNYVLVLFHDPEVDPPFISTDPDVFQQELASVTVQGGGDCPEMAMSGEFGGRCIVFRVLVRRSVP